ncbi:PH domain-containing protein [Streptomyces sp. NPDC001812]|uniref:PH domain-containing protein n=1 Tax=Streptomyces cathayae TaxID=3031124 RepID=A0ABY8K7F1_9ACTN|nr:PH domain-containing protein [Streptomyces sp. HUAS 5]WGD44060.1 PH domain-containing protein [Streptomyces sp. HUAS 5]
MPDTPSDQPSDKPALPALPVTFRPGRTRAVLLGAAAALFGALSLIALLLEQVDPGERLSFVFTGALLAGGLVLLARPRVEADESGITVVNIVGRRRLEWAQILQVNLRPGDPWVFLDLSDGTSMPVLGIQPGIARERAIADAQALRALAVARSVVDPDASRG